ncbi:MAG: hypothetical protein P8Z35_25750, partial [Ignavibacteriaceae bacterium]
QKVYETQRDKWIEEWKSEMTLSEYLNLGDELVRVGKYEEMYCDTLVGIPNFCLKLFGHACIPNTIINTLPKNDIPQPNFGT